MGNIQINMNKLCLIFLFFLFGCSREIEECPTYPIIIQEEIQIDCYSETMDDYLSKRFNNQKYVLVDGDLDSMEMNGIYEFRVWIEEINTVYEFTVDYRDITPPTIIKAYPLKLCKGILPSKQITTEMIDNCIVAQDNSGIVGVWEPEDVDSYLSTEEAGIYYVPWKSGDDSDNIIEFNLLIQVEDCDSIE